MLAVLWAHASLTNVEHLALTAPVATTGSVIVETYWLPILLGVQHLVVGRGRWLL